MFVTFFLKKEVALVFPQWVKITVEGTVTTK